MRGCCEDGGPDISSQMYNCSFVFGWHLHIDTALTTSNLLVRVMAACGLLLLWQSASQISSGHAVCLVQVCWGQ